MKQIPFPSGTLLQANSTVSKNVIQSTPLTTVSSGAQEQIKGRGGEEKVKEKTEKKGMFNLKVIWLLTGLSDVNIFDNKNFRLYKIV